MSDNAQAPESNNGPFFDIIRLYTKDSSLETPNVPEIFTKEWKPEIKVDFDTKSRKLAEDNFEVDLRVTVTAKIGEEVAYICEVHQAGIFLIKGFDDKTVAYLLNGVAPNALFPYARELISSLINRGTFPPLNLRPINFEALFQAQLAQRAQADVANGESKDEAPQA
ncbi:MAG: protein-export chaperone SecB [Succinivibrio sp.]